MTQEKSPHAVATGEGAEVSPADLKTDDTTPLRNLVMALLEAQTEASKRIAALEREVAKLRRERAAAYDWSMEVPREMREVG